MLLKKAHTLALCSVLCTLCTQHAFAQTTPTLPVESKPAEVKERTAEQWVEQGTKAYQSKQYKEALIAFKSAQQLNKSRDLYYNIGRVHEALDQPKEALDAYGKFIVSPDANIDARSDALKRMNILKQIVASREKPKEVKPKPEEKKTVVIKPPVKAPPEVNDSSPHPMTWVLLGTGVVSVGLGSYFAIQSNSAQTLAESKCKTSGSGMLCPESAESSWDDMKQNGLIADIAFATGGVLLVSSVITYIITSGNETTQKVQIAPVMTTSSASIQLHTSF